jgi:hypothetical protein
LRLRRGAIRDTGHGGLRPAARATRPTRELRNVAEEYVAEEYVAEEYVAKEDVSRGRSLVTRETRP